MTLPDDSVHPTELYVLDFSLLDPNPYSVSARLFHMTSASGVFEAVEVLNACRTPELATPLPFLQSDLYNVPQPGPYVTRCCVLGHGGEVAQCRFRVATDLPNIAGIFIMSWRKAVHCEKSHILSILR